MREFFEGLTEMWMTKISAIDIKCYFLLIFLLYTLILILIFSVMSIHILRLTKP